MISADNLQTPILKKTQRKVMKDPPPLTQEYVKSRFDYKDGHLYWKAMPNKTAQWNGKNAGRRAGDDEVKNKRGQIRLDDRGMLPRRLIWIWHHGEIPEGKRIMKIKRWGGDHIGNLRLAGINGQ